MLTNMCSSERSGTFRIVQEHSGTFRNIQVRSPVGLLDDSVSSHWSFDRLKHVSVTNIIDQSKHLILKLVERTKVQFFTLTSGQL